MTSPRETDGPLTPGQERLWFLDRLDPGDASYNVCLTHRLRGPIDPTVLAACLDEVVARHAPLRTRFPEVDGRPVARTGPPCGAGVRHIDVRDRPSHEREEVTRAVVAETTNAPFDLAAGPPLRAVVLRSAPDEHVFCLALHHIVADGWSLDIIDAEMAALYPALSTGAPSPLPPLPTHYAAHARARRARETGVEALAYWRERLADPPVLDLPTDRPRPSVRSSTGATVTVRLPTDLADRIAEVAHAARCTPYMALLALYQLLLCRYGGRDDVCVGSPVAGRERSEVEPLVGYFTDTLVLRGDLSGRPTFTELLARTRRSVLDAFEHQDIPFERLITELGVDRDLGRTPLFQTMLVFNRAAELTTTTIPGITTEPFPHGLHLAKFDVMLDVLADDEGMRCDFRYNSDLFDAATMARFAARWRTLVAEVVADPSRPVSDVRALLDGEWERLSDWADGGLVNVTAAVPDLIAGAAAETPAAPAIVCGAEVVDRAELMTRADALAGRLREAGVRPGHLVGIALPRSVGLITAMLAAWQAGAGYLPLDPDDPPERISMMVEDAGAAATITPEGVVARPGEASTVDAAYVIFTSGSTGRPKGVAVGHDALVVRVAEMMADYQLCPADRVVQFASASFDSHVEEVWPTLAAGATLVLLPDGPHTLPETLAADPEISVLDLPTAYWHRLVEFTDGLRVPPALRLVILGGEQVAASSVARWRQRFGSSVRLVNTYGPTETTVIATRADLEGGEAHPPIGRPIAGARIHVLDEAGLPASIGVDGELYVGGAGLAIGYLSAPGATAARFVPDPYGPPGSRLYRTGDRVRFRSDGMLEFRGRLDDMLKVRGHRVEPGEVEACLRAHPEVSDAAVVAREDTLIGYAVTSAPAAAVRAHAAERSPAHLVPDIVVPLDSLPLTRTGKVNARALPAPGGRSVTGRRAPHGDAEELVASIWAEVLDRDDIAADDDFFALGGHSLRVVQVAARLRDTVEAEVPVRSLFTHTTVTELAGLVEELLVAEIAELTDERAAELLAEEKGRPA